MSGADLHNGGCESCARACTECKTNVTNLEKKNFRLAIALTSALTLLGEQGVKAVVGMVESMRTVTETAPNEGTAAASPAAGSGYSFGGGRNGVPTFSGWKPAWKGVDGGGTEDGIWFPSESWDGPKDVALTATRPAAGISVVDGMPSIADMIAVATPPATMWRPGDMMVSDFGPVAADFTTPSPFGGYMAHLEVDPPHVSTVPSPGPLCVFAVGGLFGSRSRA